MWRKVLAIAVLVAAAAAAMHRLVIVPWRCNAVEGRVWRALDRVWGDRETYRKRNVAQESLEAMRGCVAACPTDVNLQMLAGSSFRVLGRSSAAISAYQRALRFDRRPELYMALGEAQLEAGAPIEQAIASFVKAGEFLGPDVIRRVPDAQARWRAYAIVGARHEKIRARAGLGRPPNLLMNPGFETPSSEAFATASASGTPPSAADHWNTYTPTGRTMTRLVASSRSGGKALHVIAPVAHSGIVQTWRNGRSAGRVRTEAWVYVVRGQIYLGSGDGRPPMANVHSSGTGRWERIAAVNDSCPASVTVLYAATPDGAEFYVDEISASPTLAAPPCES